MDANKFVSLQHQMKENQSEISDFLRDLDSWETGIKAQEQQLKERCNTNGSPLPPVRGKGASKKNRSAHNSKETAQAASESNKRKKPERIRSSDYKSWDNFDVDKALEAMDNSSSEETDSDSSDVEWQLQQAMVHKERGNDLFKQGKYDLAIEAYTQGIASDPNSAVIVANRAMAFIKQQQFGCAEADSTQAIELDPSYVKAYSRRGVARVALGRLADAKMDFEKVLSFEPNNNQAKEELAKLLRTMNPESVGIVKAIFKAPEIRSKKPMRRVPIEEI